MRYSPPPVRPASPALQGGHLGHLLALARLHTPQAPLSIYYHRESVAACDKQRFLPPGIYVQKSLTLMLSQQIVLVSGIGDFRLQRWQMKSIARLLSLSATEARKILINPNWLPAELTSGLAEGMVSPFFAPDSAQTLPLAAVILLPLPLWLEESDQVSISLSLRSSLLLPARQLPAFITAYGLRYYPHIPVLTLSPPKVALPPATSS
ncbi:MAG TPA: hypothetical protein VFV38_47685 [Ktedonobacteraceae bacterium]|nr:hypothetical protein [Ktedonobacteraceae bacterium]